MRKYQALVLIVKEAINTAVEQGLWVALMVDMAAIAGRNYEETFLFNQRKNMIELIDTLTKKELIEGFLGLGSIPNPGYYLFRMFRPLLAEMKKHGRDKAGYYYESMDPIPTALLVFVFPGMLKLLAAQIGEIVPG